VEENAVSRRIQRVRHELKRREVKVARVESLAPQYASITFQGESLDDFVSASFDDHVKFMFGDDGGEPVRRDYTPRRYDRAARELTVEFALHGDGYASDWARQAAPGQSVVIGGPRGSMIVPVDFAWHLLAGDATAFPAIRRRLEELPATARVIVLVAGETADVIELSCQAQLQVQRLAGDGELVAAVRALEFPEGEGFVWCAGEAGMAAQVRDILQQKNFPREASRISAYWKKGAADHHENL
jgi:NADPH-dependent ferric siderophore reductase